jgi:SAM-dependent methyltransferase
LELTGERTLPGAAGEQYWFARHEAAYRWLTATAPVRGAVVVDAGSGEGYGAAILQAAGARAVLALEHDHGAARHSALTYRGVRTVRANLVDLPLADDAIDLVASLQVVEHLWDLSRFLAESRRVLGPAGQLIVTTPNRPVFSPGLGRGDKPINPFHVEEFDASQLTELLQHSGFPRVMLLGVHHGDRLRSWERANGTGLVAAQLTGVGAGSTTELAAFVAGITAEDFVVGPPGGAQDLLAVATGR